jgi:hypothetical protein
MSSHTHHTSPLSTSRWESEVVPLLPAALDLQASRLGALKRKRAFPNATVLLQGLLAYALAASSLAQLGAWGVLCDTVDIAASSWLKRLRAATPWLSWLLATLLAGTPATWLSASGRWRPKIVDITTIGLLGGSGDDLRLHLSYDLLEGCFDQFRLTDRRCGEELACHQLLPDEVAVVDAGYGRRHQIAAVVQQRAAIVVRIYLPTCPLHDRQGQPLDLVQHLARRGRVALELPAQIQYAGQAIPVRVLAVPLSADQQYCAQQRLRKTARRKGRTASPTGLLLAGWLVLVTTLPQQAWSAPAVVQLYRARWQVEVAIKRIKQLLRLQVLRCQTKESAVPLVTLYLIGWALSSELVAEVRPALQAAAQPAPATLPGQWPVADAVVSSWRVQQLSLDLLRQQVWGQWTASRLDAVLARLVRHLVTHPRADRQHQESVIRARLSGRRFTPPRPHQQAV